MNKYDLLEKKLEAGAQVNRYMTSYGARANDAAAFSACTRPSHYLLMVGSASLTIGGRRMQT